MEWWQTLAVGLSSSILGGFIAVGGAYLLERSRWSHDAEVRLEQREREDAVQARERLAEIYPQLFRLLEDGCNQLSTILVIDTINTDPAWRDDEPVAALPEETQRLRDAAVERIGRFGGELREFLPELAVFATQETLVAIESLLILLEREFELATVVGLIHEGQVTPELVEEVKRRAAGIRRCARDERGHLDVLPDRSDATPSRPDRE